MRLSRRAFCPVRPTPRPGARLALDMLEDRCLLNAQLPLAAPAGGGQVVFFEADVAAYQLLAQGLPANTQAVVLDPRGDGLDQMAAFVRGRHDLSAVHLVSHGAPGALDLGSTTLDEQALAGHAADLRALDAALAPQGELLLWG